MSTATLVVDDGGEGFGEPPRRRLRLVGHNLRERTLFPATDSPFYMKSCQVTTPGLPPEVFAAGVVGNAPTKIEAAKNPGPHRRRWRVRSEGPVVVGGAIHHDLTLIDSSDDDAPFVVDRSAAPVRPSRRLVLRGTWLEVVLPHGEDWYHGRD